MTKKSAFITLLFFLLPMLAAAAIPDIKFRRLDTRDGLSNSQVHNSVCAVMTAIALRRFIPTNAIR